MAFSDLLQRAELAIFFSIYWESNLTPAQLASLSSWYKLVEWPVLTALVLGVHISLYRAIFRRRDRDLPKWVVPAVVVFAAALTAWFLLALRFPALMPQSPLITFWLLLVWPLDILDMIWLGRLLAESRKASDPGRRKADAAFAWLFLARYPVHLALTVWNPAGAEYWAIALTKLLGLYTNLLPVFWLKAYFVPGPAAWARSWAGGSISPRSGKPAACRPAKWRSWSS